MQNKHCMAATSDKFHWQTCCPFRHPRYPLLMASGFCYRSSRQRPRHHQMNSDARMFRHPEPRGGDQRHQCGAPVHQSRRPVSRQNMRIIINNTRNGVDVKNIATSNQETELRLLRTLLKFPYAPRLKKINRS